MNSYLKKNIYNIGWQSLRQRSKDHTKSLPHFLTDGARHKATRLEQFLNFMKAVNNSSWYFSNSWNLNCFFFSIFFNSWNKQIQTQQTKWEINKSETYQSRAVCRNQFLILEFSREFSLRAENHLFRICIKLTLNFSIDSPQTKCFKKKKKNDGDHLIEHQNEAVISCVIDQK